MSMASASRAKPSTIVKHRMHRPQTRVSAATSLPHCWFRHAGRVSRPRPSRATPLRLQVSDRETFLTVEPFDALVVDDPLLSQQHVQPAIPEPRALRPQLMEPLSERRFIGAPVMLLLRRFGPGVVEVAFTGSRPPRSHSDAATGNAPALPRILTALPTFL